jgi:hypothetical protein
MNDVYLQLVSVQSSAMDMEMKKKNKRNFPDGIIRHQFLNLLVKVLKDKYIVRSNFFLN